MTPAALATAAALWLAGHAVLALCGSAPGRSRLEAASLAWIVGASAAAVLVPALVLALGPLPSGPTRLALALVAAAGLAALVRAAACRAERCSAERARRPAAPAEPWTPLQRLGAATCVLLAAFCVFASATQPLIDFDPTFHFAHKGQVLWREGFGTGAWTDLAGPVGRVMTHPGYPPGLPALQCLLALVGGAFDGDAARLFHGLFAAAVAGLLWSSARERGRVAAIAASLLWLSLPFLFAIRLPHERTLPALAGLVLGPELATRVWPDAAPFVAARGWVLGGGGDLPLAACLFAAFVHVARGLPSAGRAAAGADARIAAIALGAAMLMKNEGLALAAVLVLAVGVGALASPAQRPRLRACATWILGAAVAVAPWLWFRRAIPAVDESYPQRLALADWLEQAARGSDVVTAFADAFVSVAHWSLLWPLFGVALLVRAARPRALVRGDAWLATTVVLGSLALYFTIFLVTPWELDRLFSFALPDRLMLHVAPIAVLGCVFLAWRSEPRLELGRRAGDTS